MIKTLDITKDYPAPGYAPVDMDIDWRNGAVVRMPNHLGIKVIGVIYTRGVSVGHYVFLGMLVEVFVGLHCNHLVVFGKVKANEAKLLLGLCGRSDALSNG